MYLLRTEEEAGFVVERVDPERKRSTINASILIPNRKFRSSRVDKKKISWDTNVDLSVARKMWSACDEAQRSYRFLSINDPAQNAQGQSV